MRTKVTTTLLLAGSILFLVACSSSEKKTGMENLEKSEKLTQESLSNKVLTAEEQDSLTPDMVLTILKQGNKEFTLDELTIRNNTKRIREASLGQFPKAAIVSCLDSRIPVEDVFHRGIGDLFVARVAGNFVNEDILGSLEFACKVSGSKLIVVLGHEHCGAIKSAIDDVKLGNITAMLAKIQPAVAQTRLSFEGEQTSSNPDFVDAVCIQNVKYTIDQIRSNSPILKEMEAGGEIKIVGAIYQMETGEVTYL